MYTYAYIESRLEHWPDIFSLDPRFMSRFVFRGQSNYNWNLSSSLERTIKKLYPNNIDKALYPLEEQDLLKDFKWKYPLYSGSMPEANDNVEWLTIMQHHGAPTRLLDVTNSLFIAIYFALSEISDGDAAVWAINKYPMNSEIFETYKVKHNVKGVGQDTLDLETLLQANHILSKKSFDVNLKPSLLLIKPTRPNERISRQQGAFLMPSNINIPFNENLKPYAKSEAAVSLKFHDLLNYASSARYKHDDITIMKIIIPKRLFYEIGKSLRAMNITSEILFPGLDGLCKSLSHLRYEGMGNRF